MPRITRFQEELRWGVAELQSWGTPCELPRRPRQESHLKLLFHPGQGRDYPATSVTRRCNHKLHKSFSLEQDRSRSDGYMEWEFENLCKYKARAEEVNSFLNQNR